MKLHPSIRKLLGLRNAISDAEGLRIWRSRTKNLCKPCWELKYCPYGPLVEDFPLPPIPLADAEEHNDYLRSVLKTGRFPDGSELDPKRRSMFIKMVRSFRKSEHPLKIPEVVNDASCRVFGHLCPVFFAAEPLTETKDRRTHSRTIPREVMLKVIRRDGQICQKCHQPVPDNLVEFDHIIPFSKGGASTVGNLRLLCYDCNRSKSDALNEILSENPIEHLYDLQSKGKKEKKKRRN
jgi:5-methylcytosine-specific restriction endonuclease McrA